MINFSYLLKLLIIVGDLPEKVLLFIKLLDKSRSVNIITGLFANHNVKTDP